MRARLERFLPPKAFSVANPDRLRDRIGLVAFLWARAKQHG